MWPQVLLLSSLALAGSAAPRDDSQFNYKYRVQVDYASNSYKAEGDRDNSLTSRMFSVSLPDGRLQSPTRSSIINNRKVWNYQQQDIWGKLEELKGKEELEQKEELKQIELEREELEQEEEITELLMEGELEEEEIEKESRSTGHGLVLLLIYCIVVVGLVIMHPVLYAFLLKKTNG